MAKSYAHLISGLAAKSAKSDEDEDKKMEDKDPPANDKEDGKKSKKGAKKAVVEDDDEDDKKAEDDKDDKKASVVDQGAVAEAARLEERLRCATIFGSDAAGGQPNVAARFAFHTNLDAETAIVLMEDMQRDKEGKKASAEQPAQAVATRKSLDERMSALPSASVGADADPQLGDKPGAVTEAKFAAMSPQAKALAIVNAGRAAMGEEPLKNLN